MTSSSRRASALLRVNCQNPWGNIDNFMTDSVTINLKVENYLADKLGSHHIPHLLCKAHVVEKFDDTNLKCCPSLKYSCC